MADLVLQPAPRQSSGRRINFIPLLIVFAMVVASCGSSDTDTTEAGTTETDQTETASESSSTTTSEAPESPSSATTSSSTSTTAPSTSETTEADPGPTTSEEAVETSTTQATDDSSDPPTTVTEGGDEPLETAVIGKTTDEAIAMVRATGRKVRIAVLEGEVLALTQDYDAERLNLTISGGLVKSVRLG